MRRRSDLAEAAAEELAKRGVIGRFSIDFVTTRASTGWTAHAVEINLRNGGTTHPALALLALTEGEYAPAEARFLVDGIAKHYVATDHLHVPCLQSLTPDDVLDVIDEEGIGWDASTNSGVVFHMISGVAVAGRVGFTASGTRQVRRKVSTTGWRPHSGVLPHLAPASWRLRVRRRTWSSSRNSPRPPRAQPRTNAA